MSNKVKCPACGKEIAVKGVPGHTNGCPKWNGFSKLPPSEFDFDRYYRRKLWADGMVEGEDYVSCFLCGGDHRARRLADHLKVKHQMTTEAYREVFDGVLVVAKGSLRQRAATVRERYGVDNVAQAVEIRQKLVENSRAADPDVVAKRKATNVARYGHENPFGGEGGSERARRGMKAKYGAENPQQVPEIRERTIKTTEERHGAPSTFETEGYRERFRKISQERFGADHPMQSEEGKRRCFRTIQAHHGVDTVFALPEVQARAYASNLANHGGRHSQQCPEVLAKARETWMEKYGVDNPSKCEEIKARIKEVWMGKYGVPFPPQSMWFNREQSCPNKLEQAVQKMLPAYVVFAVDGSYWVRCAGASRARNPDFVVLTHDQLEAYKAGAALNGLRTWRIIEAFGDYWHGPLKTGVDRQTHKLDVIDYYTKAGIQCLILWESEIKKHPRQTAERLRSFLG